MPSHSKKITHIYLVIVLDNVLDRYNLLPHVVKELYPNEIPNEQKFLKTILETSDDGKTRMVLELPRESADVFASDEIKLLEMSCPPLDNSCHENAKFEQHLTNLEKTCLALMKVSFDPHLQWDIDGSWVGPLLQHSIDGQPGGKVGFLGGGVAAHFGIPQGTLLMGFKLTRDE